MNNLPKISAAQLVALLLTSRLAVSLTFTPTVHQLSHGADFLLSLLLQGVLLLLLLLPTLWFARRTGGIGTLDYGFAALGRGGGTAVAVFYGLVCLYVQTADLLRFSRFAANVLSPDMSRAVLCVVLMATAGVAAFYGLQAIARSAVIIACFVVATIALAALALLPRMELINFPPLLYDGLPPVIAGALEELPRSMEIVAAGLLIPHVKSGFARGCVWWCTAFTAVALVIQTTVVGVLGDFGQMELYPYYTAITTAQISVLQRLDIVATAIWCGALFLKTAFFGMLFVECLQKVVGSRWRPVVATAGAAVALTAGLVLGGKLPLQTEQVILWYTSAVLLGLCALVLPLLFLLREALRRRFIPKPRGKEAAR